MSPQLSATHRRGDAAGVTRGSFRRAAKLVSGGRITGNGSCAASEIPEASAVRLRDTQWKYRQTFFAIAERW